MKGLLNVFARNCEVRQLDAITAGEFLDRFHRLGSTGSRYRYGLFVKRATGARETVIPAGTLVAVATFSAPRRWRKTSSDGDCVIKSYEWVRYASLEGLRVVGGMGKLLNAFVEDVHPDDIMSYADASSEDGGSVYQTLGFEMESTCEPAPGITNLKYRLKLTDWK